MPLLFAKFSSTYFWYFAVLGLSVPFLAVFLEGRGFTSREMGEILAIFTATKIFGPTLWAIFADKSGKQLPIIRLGAFLALFTFCGLFFAENFWHITLFLALFSLFWNAILPQLEVLTLTSIRRSPKIYARIRLWGSLGFVALAVAAGEVIAQTSSEAFLMMGFIILVLLFGSTLSLKQIKSVKPSVDNDSSILQRLFCWRFITFFIAGIFLQLSFGPFYSFFALFIRDLGYPGYAVGLFIGVGVVAEIGVFLLAGQIFKHLKVKTLLVFSILVTAIRWYLTGIFGDSSWILAIAQVLHAGSFGLYHSASMQFIQQHFLPNQQNRGQAIYISGVYGIGGAIGVFLAGIYWLDGKGAEHSFLLAAALALFGTIIAIFIPEKSKVDAQ